MFRFDRRIKQIDIDHANRRMQQMDRRQLTANNTQQMKERIAMHGMHDAQAVMYWRNKEHAQAASVYEEKVICAAHALEAINEAA